MGNKVQNFWKNDLVSNYPPVHASAWIAAAVLHIFGAYVFWYKFVSCSTLFILMRIRLIPTTKHHDALVFWEWIMPDSKNCLNRWCETSCIRFNNKAKICFTRTIIPQELMCGGLVSILNLKYVLKNVF